ncbi:TolC family protein [Gammaproteobacteria bacterium]|nr:TolC family protein [Gammaproteobacteria bacterium]
MTFSSGRLPSCIFVVFLLYSAAALSERQVPLTLAEAEDLALVSEPGQAALQAQASALEQRAIAAAQLPDPVLRVGLNNFPIESGGFSTEGMTHALVAVRQAFPPGKSREISARQMNLQASSVNASATARGFDVLTAVRHAWLDAYYWHRAHELVSESRPFFSDLATIARSLYAVGRRNQQDVLRAELELSRLDDRLIDIDRQYAGARAALSEWVGENAARPMATGLPNWSHVPELGEIHQGLLRHPALRAADDEIASREARVDLAEEGSKPGWALDLGYSYREGVLATGEPRSDFVSLVLTVDLPFFSKKSVDSNLSAALFDRRAAQETKAQLQRRLFSRLDAEYARWHDLSRRIDLYEQLILLQTEDQARASLVAYQSGNGDFADVMRGYIDNLNTRLEHIRLQVERAQSYALLANLGGISQ